MVEYAIHPVTICAEASQAIIVLTQSYSRLFTLRRASSFTSYIVFAAGLMQISLTNAVQPSQNISGDGGGYTFGGAPSSTELVELAIHQLAEMSPICPAAEEAKQALIEKYASQ